MYLQTYTHTLHVWLEWLKVHRARILGGLFAVLVCVQTSMVSHQVTDGFILMRFKPPAKVEVYAPRPKRKVVVRRRIVVAERDSSTSSSSSASSVHSRRPFVPHGKAASSIGLHGAAPEEGQASSSSSVSSEETYRVPTDGFPPLIRTVMPVTQVPNWGAMRTPEEWDRTYDEMKSSDFVILPTYDIGDLKGYTMNQLLQTRDNPATMSLLTEKLTWSTRYFGAYDLDSGEFVAIHPGIDIKLALGTPVGAIGGGKVYSINKKQTGLGTHVIIEHRLPDGSQYFSIYGHLEDVTVTLGDTVKPGDIIGHVGMTGNTTAAHLHLQIDKGISDDAHLPYMPDHLPSPSEAKRFVVNPIDFIHTYAE